MPKLLPDSLRTEIDGYPLPLNKGKNLIRLRRRPCLRAETHFGVQAWACPWDSILTDGDLNKISVDKKIGVCYKLHNLRKRGGENYGFFIDG